MDIIIDFICLDDAKELVEYMDTVGSQSDNLSFGAEGSGFTVNQEREFLKNFLSNEKNAMFVARHNDKIVGNIGLTNLPKRFSHRATIGVSVLKDYWGKGIATKLIKQTIDFAKNKAKLDLISLEVRTDNNRAIELYERFGFRKIGVFEKFFKINDEFFDSYIMILEL